MSQSSSRSLHFLFLRRVLPICRHIKAFRRADGFTAFSCVWFDNMHSSSRDDSAAAQEWEKNTQKNDLSAHQATGFGPRMSTFFYFYVIHHRLSSTSCDWWKCQWIRKINIIYINCIEEFLFCRECKTVPKRFSRQGSLSASLALESLWMCVI